MVSRVRVCRADLGRANLCRREQHRPARGNHQSARHADQRADPLDESARERNQIAADQAAPVDESVSGDDGGGRAGLAVAHARVHARQTHHRTRGLLAPLLRRAAQEGLCYA